MDFKSFWWHSRIVWSWGRTNWPQPLFKSQQYQEFWLRQAVSERYPSLWKAAKIFFIAFPTSYLVERGFSVVSQILTKSRNRLNVVERGDLRLRLTDIAPDIGQLMSQHQVQPSHWSRVNHCHQCFFYYCICSVACMMVWEFVSVCACVSVYECVCVIIVVGQMY